MQNENDAREIVRELDGARLPPADGVLWLRNIAVGNEATRNALAISVACRPGRSLYTVSARRGVDRVLRLTASLHASPGGTTP